MFVPVAGLVKLGRVEFGEQPAEVAHRAGVAGGGGLFVPAAGMLSNAAAKGKLGWSPQHSWRNHVSA